MTLKTLENALDVLSYFTLETPEWGLRELARTMDMNHTVLHRILKTYEKKGYLIQNEVSKNYELGLKFLEFSSVIKQKMKLSEFVVPVMKELAESVNETVFLTLKDGREGVTVEIAECKQQIQFNVAVGTRTPLYVGASCKVIMAFIPEKEQLEILETGMKVFTEKTMTDKELIRQDLKDISEKGWSFTKGEFSESVFGIGVPLFNDAGTIIGSLTIAGPSYRMPEEKLEEALQIIQTKTATIQRYFNKFGSIYY
ncbi:IclR family transcriptional regulator [Sporosarcina sp. FSL K6-1522]|uniref:IclR family transcriptional regulator n=1 Tax=Sporosarcina sp. FSL K6-1522 TaxID=2921554 RepID=UPI00315A9D9A